MLWENMYAIDGSLRHAEQLHLQVEPFIMCLPNGVVRDLQIV